MTERLKDLIKWSDAHMDQIPWRYGIFKCHGPGSDLRVCIYDKDGVELYACYGYKYVDVIGLTDEEFDDYSAFLRAQDEDDEEDEV